MAVHNSLLYRPVEVSVEQMHASFQEPRADFDINDYLNRDVLVAEGKKALTTVCYAGLYSLASAVIVSAFTSITGSTAAMYMFTYYVTNSLVGRVSEQILGPEPENWKKIISDITQFVLSFLAGVAMANACGFPLTLLQGFTISVLTTVGLIVGFTAAAIGAIGGLYGLAHSLPILANVAHGGEGNRQLFEFQRNANQQ